MTATMTTSTSFGHDQQAGRAASRPWNHGCKIGPKKALKPKEIWAIRFELSRGGRIRDRALFDLAIDSKLRGCDLVALRIGDVVSSGKVRRRATIVQKKTKQPVQFEITEPARDSLLAWLTKRGGGLDDVLFPSRLHRCAHLTTRQYARLVDDWVGSIGLDPADYGTHSLRRTKASLIYKRTGNLRAVQILLGHTRIESTVRYLGVDIEDALALAEGTDI
ncbi:MAG: tyrosine-type recombinase/integrase [Paracoccaceae bacterium]